MERGTVRHRTGTVAIEGDQVVIHMGGTRTSGLLRRRSEPWERTLEVPLAQATAVVNGTDLAIYRNGRAIQALLGCAPVEMEAFLDALDDARLEVGLTRADCSTCGAHGQTVGHLCGYCRAVVLAPA